MIDADNIKDYRLTVTVKNNRMLALMEQHGIESVAELSRQTGITYGTLGGYLRLLIPAYSPRTQDFRPSVKRLCEFFKCLPDHIFPEEHLHNPLQTNTSSVEVSMEELRNIPGLIDNSPEVGLIESDVHNALYTALGVLTDRQKDVLSMRFGLLDGKEYTYREIGEKYGVGVECARQIEQKALRILRNPSRSNVIRDALGQDRIETPFVPRKTKPEPTEPTEPTYTKEEIDRFTEFLLMEESNDRHG